jgi:hypothetical protein
MTTTLSPSIDLDAEIDRLRLAARAERALDALGEKGGNPFEGSGEQLQAREVEREQIILRQEGDVLNRALADLSAVNAELSEIADGQREAATAIRELRPNPVIVRWLAASQRADATGTRLIWSVVGPFLASEAPWESRPSRVSDRYVAELPEAMRFSESDRPTIRHWEALADRVRQLNYRSKAASGRQERLLQMHPALRSLPATAPPA